MTAMANPSSWSTTTTTTTPRTTPKDRTLVRMGTLTGPTSTNSFEALSGAWPTRPRG